jgi:hypothetical protein
MQTDDDPSSLRNEAQRLRDNLPERRPSVLRKAIREARKAGWGAESDDFVKLLVFVAVLLEEALGALRRRRRGRPS